MRVTLLAPPSFNYSTLPAFHLSTFSRFRTNFFMFFIFQGHAHKQKGLFPGTIRRQRHEHKTTKYRSSDMTPKQQHKPKKNKNTNDPQPSFFFHFCSCHHFSTSPLLFLFLITTKHTKVWDLVFSGLNPNGRWTFFFFFFFVYATTKSNHITSPKP
ncbi:MAG: hypothetical protein JOS17DRAFT_595394 [Linnemannia elongata]|nr:MAG: hypothetical protein JOS17DRAFT_595394 [Linnemannia elongata]